MECSGNFEVKNPVKLGITFLYFIMATKCIFILEILKKEGPFPNEFLKMKNNND